MDKLRIVFLQEAPVQTRRFIAQYIQNKTVVIITEKAFRQHARVLNTQHVLPVTGLSLPRS